MAERTTIRVTKAVRDHLARLAEDRGVTMGRLVEQLAAAQPTADQIAERLLADREAVRVLIGVDISGEELDQTPTRSRTSAGSPQRRSGPTD